jgi:chromate transporter
VTEFVGFLAAFRAADPLHPLIAGCLGAALTVWMTFAPSFLFIFAGAPLFEHMRSYPRLSAAFQAITSVIVGVIAWVGVWFALHLFFASVTMFETGLLRIPLVPWGSFQLGAAGLSALAALMFFILRLPLGAVLVLTILAGFGVQALGFS